MRFDDLKFEVNFNPLGGVIGSVSISPDVVAYVRMGSDTYGCWEVHAERGGSVVKMACLPEDGYVLVSKPCQVSAILDKMEEMALDCVGE